MSQTGTYYQGFKDDLVRAKRRAGRDTIVNTALFPELVFIDFILPLVGGLSEIDLVWLYMNVNAWLTAKDFIKRLGPEPAMTVETDMALAIRDHRQMPLNGQANRGGKNNKECGDGKPKKIPRAAQKESLQVVFYPTPAMEVMSRYVQQTCHKVNPEAFPAMANAPSEADVLAAMGWHPERRGREHCDERDDMNVSN